MKVLAITNEVAKSGPNVGQDIVIVSFQSPAAGDIGRREFGVEFAGRDAYAGNGVKAAYVFTEDEFATFCDKAGIADPEDCIGTEIKGWVTTLTLQDNESPGFFQPVGMEDLGWRKHSIARGEKYAIVTDTREPELQKASLEYAQARREAERQAAVEAAAEARRQAEAKLAKKGGSKAAPKAAAK
jgi:hypothetical protein